MAAVKQYMANEKTTKTQLNCNCTRKVLQEMNAKWWMGKQLEGGLNFVVIDLVGTI